MREQRKRRRLALRAAALGAVLVLLCCCLLPAFATQAEPTEELPGQTQDEDELFLEETPEEPDVFPEEEPEGQDELAGTTDAGADEMPEEQPDSSPEEPESPEAPEEAELPLTPEKEPEQTTGEPAEKVDEDGPVAYFFWLSEEEEAEGGLPYAEQTVESGEELLMPEDPEMDGKIFRYWYTRDEEGTATRFDLSEEMLWPGESRERSLYACFVAEAQETLTDALSDDEETPLLSAQTGEEDSLTGAEQKEGVEPDPERPGEEASDTEDVLPEENTGNDAEDEEELELLAMDRTEDAAVFLLKAPTCDPESNDVDQWAPDNSECRWLGRVNTKGAVWQDQKNVFDDVAEYIVSWPDGSTGAAWTLGPDNRLWDDVVDEIWEEYKETIESATGVTGLEKDDLESITVTPYKISRDNGTTPDKHIDCTISVRSKKSFTARFNVRAPGAKGYTIVDSCEYQSGERVSETDADIEQEIDIGGVRYVFEGWYKEDSGPDIDTPGEEMVTQDEWDEGYLPTEDELQNGVVNFYAHYVLADIEPDTGVTVSFFALPLVLGAGAAGLGCKTRKKEEEE